MPKNENWKGKADPPAGFQISTKPLLEGDDPSGTEEIVSKYTSATSPEGPVSSESGELPRSYDAGEIFLIAQEPHRLFIYWDIDVRSHPGGPAVIRCLRVPSGGVEVEFEVPFETRNWYIPVGKAGCGYRVEIGYYRNEQWHELGKSDTAWTPPDTLSSDTSFQFTTLNADSAFAALLSSVPDSMRKNPDFLRQLLEWQRSGGKLPHDLPLPDAGTVRALLLLKEILGGSLLADLIAGGSGSSGELSSRIEQRLAEVLSSEASSGLLARFREAAAGSSLFSGILSSEFLSGGALSSGALSSLSAAAAAGSESLSSFGGPGSESLSSGIGASAWSSETLSSWREALMSWAQAARTAAASEWLASWGVVGLGESSSGFVPTSWAGAMAASWGKALSSWTGGSLSSLENAQSASWFQAALSSWMHEQAASWFGAQTSSWGAESLSSWMRETLSSAGAAESGSWAVPAAPRGFYMHVNAEVIFYGGTHPDAKVTIDGDPVSLDSNGNFRFHFLFPDGAYQIPIIAVSPDGKETRKAVLRFERSTEKTGKVDDTSQPPLPSPMGAVR